MKSRNRFWVTAILAWLVFIGIDFFFHASLLQSLWEEEIVAFKPSNDLFALVPFGYVSFLLLTILVGYCFTKMFPSKPEGKQVVKFSLIFGILYSLSNLLGLYSYVNIPIKHLVSYNLVYFIEILAIVFVFYKANYRESIKKIIWYSVLTFFMLVIVGIIIQNII
jgi:hypothetical protein